MTRRILTLGLLAGTAAPLPSASAQSQHWIRQFGTSGQDGAHGAVADGTGGVFLAGYTRGSLGGPFAGGYRDGWLARYDASGNQLWVRQIGTSGDDAAGNVAADGAGGVYIAGGTDGGFGGPGSGTVDGWLARYDAAGNQVWIRQFLAGNGDNAAALAPDSEGGVFVAGSIVGNGTDTFVARYDGSGNETWFRQFGGAVADYWIGAAADGAGGMYAAGRMENYHAGVARYDAGGNQLWNRYFASAGNDGAYEAAPDGLGGAFIAGFTTGNLGGPNVGMDDAWIARYDPAGSRLWIRQFGTSGQELAHAIAPDASGGVYLGGGTTGSLALPNAGSYDIWLSRYNGAGNQVWMTQFGGSGNDFALAAAPDAIGGVYFVGETASSLGGPISGGSDVWLARYGPAPCYPNCDGSTPAPVLNVNDFICFMNRFAAGESYANCDASTAAPVLNVNDFICFTNAFASGCP